LRSISEFFSKSFKSNSFKPQGKTILCLLFCAILLLPLSNLTSTAEGAETYTFVTKWGSIGTDDGQFTTPTGIAVDGSGYVYVADMNMRVQKFKSSNVSNTYSLTVTKSGTGSGTVTSSSGTLTWSGNTGTASYASGTSVVLTAAAASGSVFFELVGV
jgi:hypothetical protein